MHKRRLSAKEKEVQIERISDILKTKEYILFAYIFGSFTSEDSFKDMTEFRNRLIHLYWEVDDEQVYEILQTRLDDFKTFLNNMAVFFGIGEVRIICKDVVKIPQYEP